MLKVQEYLMSGKTIADLGTEFGIKANFHPVHPLVILNYDQIDSPKMHPIVRECRGIVLETTTFEVIAACMERFFNMGEALEITENFDWNKPVTAFSKEDGSLMTLFNYNDEWMVKTRGSWADQPIGENMPCWDELFFSLLPLETIEKTCGSKCITYIFEMCSMYNQVVRQYPDPKLFLLTAIVNLEGVEGEIVPLFELDSNVCNELAKLMKVYRPEVIDITNVDTVRAYITKLEETDGTAEGLVLRDANGLRIKVKSKTYLAYSQLGGNGNIAMTKHLVPLILANEQDEAIAIFPAIKPRVEEVQAQLAELATQFSIVWNEVHGIENQKEFAIKLQSFQFPLQSILFKMKQNGTIFDGDLDKEFRNASDLLIKILKG